MNIEISKDECRDLLEVLHIANWVMHAHETEPDPGTERYDRIIQKIYSLANTEGLGSLVEADPRGNERSEMDTSAAWDFIDEFTNNSFWDELIHRLTDRDMAHLVNGYEQLEKLSMEERFMREAPIIERYANEFDDHGLDRLQIVEHFATESASPTRTSD
jgi:hypothetical protein